MNAYGNLLKKLIRFTNIKLTNLAEIVGYDTSYISKWCNKGKLPAAKAASNVNKCMAGVFAGEIFQQEETALFVKEFKTETPADEAHLTSIILHLLKDAYKKSYDSALESTHAITSSTHRLLLWPPDIRMFFRYELPQMIEQMNSECHMLCTMDICCFLQNLTFDSRHTKSPGFPVNIKMGLNLNRRDKYLRYIRQLYFLMNQYNYIRFEFYDNSSMDLMNTIVIRDCVAVQCSLDKDYHISIVSVITDISQVNMIYQKVAAEFTLNRLLIHCSNSEELFYNGYRTEFYAHNDFQILLTRGFEFLLPPEINPRLIQAAKEQGFDENMSQLIAQLGITWEEIFEKGCIDFYLLKTSIMQYITDGIIYFADVVYHMSVNERRSHLEHILELIQKNPNIRFFIIDDEFIPNSDTLIRISVYNNKKKMFLKNIGCYNSQSGPLFYTIQNDVLIQDISDYFSRLTNNSFCNLYESEDVIRFYKKYGTMIDRMLSLGEDA